MRHNELEEAIVKYIKINKNFNTSDLCLSSDEIHGNEQIIAEVHGITQHCRPDVIAYNFLVKNFIFLVRPRQVMIFLQKIKNQLIDTIDKLM